MAKRSLYLIPILWATISINLWAQAANDFPYNLEEPLHLYTLPESLEEISGLTYYADGQLAALNDEHGRVYVFDINERKVVHRIRFEGDGDFEGIELVDNYMYAIKSNGKLYRFNIEMEGVVEKLPSPFNSKNDIEGLGYDPDQQKLLVALKGDGDIKGVDVKGKAIYGFNLGTDKFEKLPLYTLKDKDVERVLGAKYKKIKPSGIAVHPISGEVYVIASSGRALVVFHKNGKPKNLSLLRSKLFPQPEGIAFAPNGDLFISNEREGEGGTILHFKMK